MSRYHPKFSKLPRLDNDADEEETKVARDFNYLLPRRAFQSSRINLEDSAPSEFKTEIKTHFGQFSYNSSMGATFKDYLQNLIVFLLGIDPTCSETMFARRVRNVIVDEKELSRFNYDTGPVNWNASSEEDEDPGESLEEMQNAEAAIKFTSSLPKLKQYSVSILSCPRMKMDSVASAIKKHAKLSEKALAQFLRTKIKRPLVLPAESAKELYIALRTVGAILVIREPSIKKSTTLSVSEKRNLKKPSIKLSRIVIQEDKKKVATARLATIQDIARLKNILK